MEPAPALAAAAEPAADAPLAAAVQPSTRKRRGWLSQLPTSASAAGDGELEESGFGHYRSPPLLGLARAAGLKLGVVSTSDSLDATPLDLQLMAGEGASVKEMEAAAVAWTCQQLGVPFVALKSITDLVDGAHATRGEFESNLATAAASLQAKLAAVLGLLENRPLNHWGE